MGDGAMLDVDAYVSLSVMRRSIMRLALRTVTAGSNGCSEMGTDTRSCGPTGVVGTVTR